jgi:hypothetical protein
MDQLKFYISTDFNKKILNKTKIVFATNPNQITTNCDILIVPADIAFINKLVELSYVEPFMRVIVDDFTNMNDVEEYRQIWASSTLFVSGSGFDRDKNKIPSSYYTLRNIEVEKYSIVSNTEDTKKGIRRDIILTCNLLGSSSNFSTYNFVANVEEACANKFQLNPGIIYEPIEKNGNLIKDYFSLMFIFKNLNKLSMVINLIEKDLASGRLPKERVQHYLQWKELLNKKSKVLKNGKHEEIDNPLLKALYNSDSAGNQQVSTLVNQPCSVCGKTSEVTYDYGFISTCCGSFFCADCAKAMCTKVKPNEYYCVVCHKLHPTYFVNSTRNKRNNLQSWHLIEDFMDVGNVNVIHTDYYFKMFIEGLKPKYADGRKIQVQYDSNGKVLQLFAKDRLTMNLISLINECLRRLEIKPGEMNEIKPCVLFYDCPTELHGRIKKYFETFSKSKDSNLYQLDILFKRNMGELIGLHRNIFCIIVWNEPNNVDEIHQLIGRILRLNTWNNPLYFYITCKVAESDKVVVKTNEIKLGETITSLKDTNKMMEAGLCQVIEATKKDNVETDREREDRIEKEAYGKFLNAVQKNSKVDSDTNSIQDTIVNMNPISESKIETNTNPELDSNPISDSKVDTKVEINPISDSKVDTNTNHELIPTPTTTPSADTNQSSSSSSDEY